jgi:hypothetical protein
MLQAMMLRIMTPLPERDPARARLRAEDGHLREPIPADPPSPIVHPGKLHRSIVDKTA